MHQQHQLKVTRTALYYLIGTPGKHIKRLVIACHGQGQLAKHFVRRFDVLDDGETLVIAPEALSKFYLKDMRGEVGACWMTREDRLIEIADYSNYLQQLFDHFVPQLHEDVKITLFGFSQGGATIFRWAMEKFPAVHQFISFGSMIPEDLDYLPHLEYFNSKKLIWMYGTSDQFLTSKYVEFNRKFIASQKLNFEERTFDGSHEVLREVVLELFG